MQYTCRSSRDYYKQYLKGAFINHSDENLPERIEQLFQGARKDADYLLTKVSTPTKHAMSYMMLKQDLKMLFDGALWLCISPSELHQPQQVGSLAAEVTGCHTVSPFQRCTQTNLNVACSIQKDLALEATPRHPKAESEAPLWKPGQLRRSSSMPLMGGSAARLMTARALWHPRMASQCPEQWRRHR